MPATDITCHQIYYVTPTEVNGVKVDMSLLVQEGEILTGTPTITVSGMTASSPLVSTTQLLFGEPPNQYTVDAGKAVTFTLTGGTDGTDYSIKVSCGTSASRTREAHCLVKVRIPTTTNP
jgi:hypothetical protein